MVLIKKKFITNNGIYYLTVIGLFITSFLISGCMAPQKDIVFINGDILTMDGENSVNEALVIKKGRIVFVGSNEDAEDYKDNNISIVDLKGKTMLPGFVDGHSHFPASGINKVMVDLNSPPIGTITKMEDLKAALSARAKTTKSGDWIQGLGYDDTLLAEKRHPTLDDLDEVSTSHPIFLTHISGHLGTANSKALAIAGIDADTEAPVGGIIQIDPDTGLPNGVLEERAMELVQDKIPQFSVIDILRMVLNSCKDYSHKGVTTAQSGVVEKTYLNVLGLLSKLRLLPLRLVVYPDADAGYEIISDSYKAERNFNSDFFDVGAIKLFADGSIQGYTGYLSEPYYVQPEGETVYRGYPRMPREELANHVKAFHDAGYQIAIHGNGDAAIDDILFAFESAQYLNPQEDLRHIVIHAQMARDDQLDKMKTLGVVPSFFILHTYYWGDRHINIFMGPERAARMSPAKSAVDRGIKFTLHADTPVVPMDPMLMTWAAVNRLSYGGTVVGEDQRITTIQALRALTIDSAYQSHMEDTRGSIETGKFADLVILSGNPLDSPESIKDIEVLETIVDGRSVYKKTSWLKW